MVNKTAIASFDRPRGSYFLPDYIGEVEMISEEQRRTLTSLIYTYIQGDSECEARISQLDDLSFLEAENCILDFSFARWK